MNKVMLVLLSLVLFGSFALTQAADKAKAAMPMMDQQMMQDGDGKGMMDCPMMKGSDGKGMMGGMMKHHQMMMHETMQMIIDMMAIQKKMFTAATPENKEQIGKDLSAMLENMDKMISSPQCIVMDMKQPVAGEQKQRDPTPAEHRH